jgi:ankyrin repeat protein
MAMLNLEEPTCIEFTKFLISKGADVNLGDVNMVTPLHILAAYKPVADHNLDGKAKLA